ncbi:succinylglutamate desuccinylase/aspartoacylase domain-containing protein [Rubinisphaera margarita]|uniref:succinylglutamate desuccinylase/aspartoacylase domain-containing protein n=1 Tax=Rubinisphaera margarita TaxID=2909586 RepID=UPI001EE8EE50|nr:succinylglutamate desuccinylase/aspartoacylase family protein [Rubinisphaera margarita]MCG6157317.1 succinylglutamate desuccinylase/aspartoacylase family protein [Rubinisphaera margarita]
MTEIELTNPLTCIPFKAKRILGQHSQGRAGPLLVVLAGIHGNEPSGVQGLASVIHKLQADDPPFFGTMVGIVGNLKALAAGVRYIDEDLNRIWLPERIDSMREGRNPESSEEAELREIIKIIDNLRHPEDRNFFLDCHTTSSESVPYISVPLDLPSVKLAGDFPVHSVIGSGDKLTGVSDRYLIDHGFSGFTFEAGRHDRLASIEAQEAAIWVALHQVGCMAEIPVDADQCLKKTQIDGHKFYEIEYIHKVTPEQGFQMKPGYCNFQRIHEGDLLAWEQEHPIISEWDARLFLPLYQPLGDDGFSIIREANQPLKKS